MGDTPDTDRRPPMPVPGPNAAIVLVVLFGILAPAVGGALLDRLAPGWTLPAIGLHAVIEAGGGVIALVLAALLRVGLRTRDRRHPDLWIGAALIGMGTLDLFHAALDPGQGFVFLHSGATFLGGLLFACVLLPRRLVQDGKLDALPLVVGAVALGLAAWAVWGESTLPAMLVDGSFTTTARLLNFVGGALFFAAAATFGFAFRRDRTWDSLLFSAHCTLFGSAGVLFELSSLWDGPWWWWHVLRLGAYTVAIGYLLVDYARGQARIHELVVELDGSNRALEERVVARTHELAATNARLRTEMTERERLEKARWDARLQHAQKLESLGVLAGGIAHDFNNLLVGMLGNATMAMEDLPPGHRARPAVEAIELTARRAAELTRQMLAYSGKGRFVVEALDLSAVVGEMSNLLEVSASKKASLVSELAPGLPLIQADVTQLRQVVMNLITNASDALGDKPGTVRIVTGTVHADRRYLEDTEVGGDLDEGQYVFVEVSDTGRGMTDAERARMFDPFFTTKDTGHGLGLAATLGILRGHQGTVRVYSELGQGTAVKVLFPVAAGAVATPSPRPVTGQPKSALVGVVLVVDDQEVVRSLARRALERAGLTVLEAEDGQAALERYRDASPKVDVVLLDLTMPRLSGEETFAELRRMDPGVKVLLMSGYNAQDTTSRFVGKGLAGFLQKPFAMRELIEKIAALLRADPR